MINWLKSQLEQISKGGTQVLFYKGKKFFFFIISIFLIIPCLPLFLIMRLISNFLLIRFCRIPSARVGHLILDVDLYFNTRKKKFFDFDIFYLEKPISNSELIRIYKRHLYIIPETIIKPFLYLNKPNFLGDTKHEFVLNKQEGWVCRSRKDDNFKYFNRKENEIGEAFLKNLNINKDSKFICLLCRDDEFTKYLYKKTYDKSYLNYGDHSTFRNSNIENFRSSCEYLLKMGYYIFRVGEKVSKPFNIKNKNFFDYSTNGMRTEFLDIYLGSRCEFFLTTASGIDAVSEIFHRPRLNVSNARIGYIPTYYHKQLTITKHFLRTEDDKKITLSEIFDLNLASATKNDEFIKKKVKLIENNSDEIKDAVIEMLDLIKNNFNASEERIYYERKFWSLFKKKIRQNNLHHIHQNLYFSKFGLNFLKQNPNLLI